MHETSALDNSGTLFDNIKRKKKIGRDGELAELIGEHASVVSEIRHGRRAINDKLLVRICERTGITLKSARAQIAEAKS
jgi:plasmid maintenance system antidote protein VapI